jgi:hypothetical protein
LLQDVGLPWPQDSVAEDFDHPPEYANTPRPLVFSLLVMESAAKFRCISFGLDGRMAWDGWMLATQSSRNDSNRIFFLAGSVMSFSDRLAMMNRIEVNDLNKRRGIL